MNRNKHNAGISVMEILIILAVLGVIAAITIPKFRVMVQQSREGRTKTSLGEIRGAIAIYYSDNFGLYPSDAGSPDKRLSQTLVPQYIKEMPEVELTHLHPKKMNTVNNRFDDGGDWVYKTLNGFVAVNCSHSDTKGKPISNW